MTVPFGNKAFRKDCRISEMRSYGLFAIGEVMPLVTVFSGFFSVPFGNGVIEFMFLVI